MHPLKVNLRGFRGPEKEEGQFICLGFKLVAWVVQRDSMCVGILPLVNEDIHPSKREPAERVLHKGGNSKHSWGNCNFETAESSPYRVKSLEIIMAGCVRRMKAGLNEQ